LRARVLACASRRVGAVVAARVESRRRRSLRRRRHLAGRELPCLRPARGLDHHVAVALKRHGRAVPLPSVDSDVAADGAELKMSSGRSVFAAFCAPEARVTPPPPQGPELPKTHPFANLLPRWPPPSRASRSRSFPVVLVVPS
jgi:hypothetical protein